MRFNIVNEINNFKLEVQKGGMTLNKYFNRTKQIRSGIDKLSNNKLFLLRYLLFLNKITMDQYIRFKMKIEHERIEYKRLLSFE